MQLPVSLSRRAAARRGILDAAWRKLKGFGSNGQRTLLSFYNGQPNNSLQPTLASESFIIKLPDSCCVVAGALARSAEFGR